MLRVSDVPYLAWAQARLERPSRVCLVDSGLRTPLETLGLDLGAILGARPSLTGDTQVPRALGERYHLPPEEMLPVLGTSMGIFLVCAALVKPGDVVLVEQPGYDSLVRVPAALGARVVRFARRREAGWVLEPEKIMEDWVPGTRMILVSDLHNPTGRLAGDDALARLGREASRRGAVVLVDEVYRDFRPGAPGSARHRDSSMVTVSSLTKVYGLGPLRLGWISAPPGVLECIRGMTRLLHVLDPSAQQAFFLAALGKSHKLQELAHRRSREGWAVVKEWVTANPGLNIVEPHGGIVAWVELPPGRTGNDVAGDLAKQGVTMVPGGFFGDDRGLRFSFSSPAAEVQAGLDALVGVLR